MATIKSYTDLEQSKKLAEILQLESADMCYDVGEDLDGYITKTIYTPLMHTPYSADYIPCWSLASLFNVLPVIIGDVLSENALRLRIDKSETDFNVWYDNIDTDMVEEGFDIIESNPVDACYEMILKLHELNLL